MTSVVQRDDDFGNGGGMGQQMGQSMGGFGKAFLSICLLFYLNSQFKEPLLELFANLLSDLFTQMLPLYRTQQIIFC